MKSKSRGTNINNINKMMKIVIATIDCTVGGMYALSPLLSGISDTMFGN